MDYSKIKSAIEGLLFAVGDEGIDLKQLASILEEDTETIKDIIYDMQADYKRETRGLQIVQFADSFQLATLPIHAEYFERLASSPTSSTLSQAALETLAIIAYKQPITRVDIEEIRGVQSDRAIKTLVMKELIKEIGRKEAIGRPILYGTTKEFLDYFGLKGLDGLPKLVEQIEFDDDDEDIFLFS